MILTCPKCTAQLQSPDDLAPNRRLTCSKCAQVFTRPQAAPSQLPEAVLLDDEPEPPPLSRRSTAADDDRPRPRRDDAPPTRPAPRQRSRVHPGILLSCIVGVFALLVGGVIALVAVFRSSSSATDLLTYLPNDTVLIDGYDVKAAEAAGAFHSTFLEDRPAHLKELERIGFAPAKIAQTLAVYTHDLHRCAVVRLKDAPNADAIFVPAEKGQPYATLRQAGQTYRYGYFAKPDILIVADDRATIAAVHAQRGKSQLPLNLREKASVVRGPVWRVVGALSPNERNLIPASKERLVLRTGSTLGAAHWLVPDGGDHARVEMQIDYADMQQATVAWTILNTRMRTLQLEQDVAVWMKRHLRNDPLIEAAQRGYAEAVVDHQGNRVTVRAVLPNAEALRFVSSLGY